jgi:creatinine amidohydrolase
VQDCLFVAELCWPEVEQILAQDVLAILPIGAACKEHGPHLPLNTDYLQAEWLARNTALTCPSLIWPTIGYGFYPSFVEYPGSCSLSAQTFADTVQQILQGIVSAGASRILIINTGISTIPPLESMLAALDLTTQIHLFNAYAGSHFSVAVEDIEEQACGHHADEIETSIMLALAPQLVDMDKAACCTVEREDGPLNRHAPELPNYSPSGVLGDARLATTEKGSKLTAAMLKDMAEAINKLLG